MQGHKRIVKGDFGDILKQFEGSQKVNKKTLHNTMLDYMDKYGVVDKDKNVDKFQKEEKVSYKKMTSDDTLDLHGATVKEALNMLQIFFDNAVKNRYKKVSIIHGKGKHSKIQAVLQDVVREFLEKNKHAGRMGFEKNVKGGSGTTWVLLKYDVDTEGK
jgi:uncharacterized protein TP_0674